MLFVEGRRAEESSGMIDDPDTTENSPSMRFAKRLFNIMDENKDGVLTMEEFVKGFHKLKVDGSNYGGVIVTAYVNERKLTKEDLLPKPAIPLRRKSLRRGSDLKLFKNDEAKPGKLIQKLIQRREKEMIKQQLLMLLQLPQLQRQPL